MLAALTAPAFAICASAQVTTSAISGQVVDENNQPVIGASVIAVHNPSGTRYRAVTNKDGRYTIQGMRTGGPYTVKVAGIGYGERTYEKLYLELGVALPINVELRPNEKTLGEATVTTERKQRGGASENFSTAQIQNVPTVDRNVYDLVKNSPMAMTNKDGGITFAGSNNRYNSFQVDGVVMNDVFGLAGSGTNGGQTSANPISMDAIQEMQVVVAPFDVRQSGFTGGAINVVTKQGTNETHASAYTFFNNQSMYGKYSAVRDYAKIPMTQQYERTYGGTLGGAIVKDKLFYFVSAEAKKQSYPVSVYPGYTPQYITAGTAGQIADQFEKLTGISEKYGQRNVDNKSFGLLARLDWNINDQHKLALRYQHNNSYDDKYGAGSTSYTFNNSSYRQNNKTNSIVAELNSHLSDELYNELRASATFVRDFREVAYQGPTVQIYNLPGADGSSSITGNIGTDYSSGANELNQDIYSVEDNLSWYKGDHSFTFGTHNEFYKINNLFIQASNGSWYYDSLNDFLNDTPSKFTYKYTDPELTGGNTKYAPFLKAGQFGFYAQDKWTLNQNFNATLGLRIDIPVVFNDPTTNPEFNKYADSKNFGVHVGEMPGAKVLVSPRLGFNWYVNDSHETLIRGGVGIFTGRVPFVWLSNAFNNTGMELKGTTISKKNVPTLGKYAKDPMQALTDAAGGGSAAKPDIVTIDKDFKYPQVLRANLALEQQLIGGVKFTLEGVYSKTMNNVFFENLAISKTGKMAYAVPGVEASAAPIYSNEKSNYYSIINLKNTNKGYTYAITAQLEKRFNFGLDLSASYTFSRAKSVNDGKSSVANSNWKKNPAIDTNAEGELGFSKYDIPHRILVQASYTSPKYLNGWMSTTIAVVYNGFSGSRYSLVMGDATRTDFNGDGASGNSLLYIPTQDELQKMQFADTKNMTAEEHRAAFGQWIANDSYAKNHRGQFAERNSNLSKWEHEIDLHISQNIHNIKGLGKLEFTCDIINFANMLNKKWGATYGVDWNYSPLQIASLNTDAAGNQVATYTFNPNNAPKKSDISSRWHCQIGFRLTF